MELYHQGLYSGNDDTLVNLVGQALIKYGIRGSAIIISIQLPFLRCNTRQDCLFGLARYILSTYDYHAIINYFSSHSKYNLMEIRAFAERILFGNTLQDKLAPLDHYQDSQPGQPLKTPDQPGRPAALALDNWHQRQRVRFSEVRNFHSEKERGLVLHFFANHELLALELMALALLKFPQAPPKFRRGLVQTLRDEQLHVQLYQERMHRIGLELGTIPVSDFFWRTIAPVESPLEFVAYLSLTLEQANLDYAVHYAQVYHDLGDQETAAVLTQVYRDEISHVKHGLTWFRRWHTSEESDWQIYQRLLSHPLHPGRAKGIGFNRDGRQRAGLDREFIDELEVYSYSKGRCPAVYVFNPECEARIAQPRTNFTLSRGVEALKTDLAVLPMFFCAPDDTVLVPQRPSTKFLQRLHQAGFSLPEFAVYDSASGLSNHPLTTRKLRALRPWGWSPDSARLLAPLQACLPAAETGMDWHPTQAAYFRKSWSAALLREFLQELDGSVPWLADEHCVGVECHSIEALEEQASIWRQKGVDHLVAKGDLGAAGRDQMHWQTEALEDWQRRRLEKLLAIHKCIVLEPWLDKVFDLSAQIEIEAPGQGRYLDWTRFFTDGLGHYRGACVSQRLAGLDTETKRFLYGNGQDQRRLQKLFEMLTVRLAAHLAPSGYVGPLGIDAFVYRQNGTLQLKPVVEINPRFTMGRIALALIRRINSARTGLWLTIHQKDINAAGFDQISTFATHLLDRYPARLLNEQLVEGVVFTNDPTQATQFATLLLVGKDLEQCKTYLAHLPGPLNTAINF